MVSLNIIFYFLFLIFDEITTNIIATQTNIIPIGMLSAKTEINPAIENNIAVILNALFIYICFS